MAFPSTRRNDHDVDADLVQILLVDDALSERAGESPGLGVKLATEPSAHYDRQVIELGHVTERRPPFRYAAYTRVAFSDTDAQAVVYYGRYLPYFDLARTEYHRHLGPLEAARSEFVMRASSVEYLAPARFDDLLEVFVRISTIGRTSVTYEFEAYRIDSGGGESESLMVTAKQVAVLIEHENRATVPVPDSFRKRISEFEGVEL